MSADSMSRIRDVWRPNLEQEMLNIRELIETYPYIAMDTEFPGVVARPIGQFKTHSDYHYQTMRCNVDMLKIIQIGLTLMDEEGESPQDVCTWQFNFQFSLAEDIFAPESIELLQKAGIDFQRHEEIGILPEEFAELMISSGLVLEPEPRWLSFHSGYDFGYFVKLLSGEPLPETEDAFFELLRIWFPHIYDIKFLMRSCQKLKGGLQEVADTLGVERIGVSHQAGSDSLLTGSTFFRMREVYFDSMVNDYEYNQKLFGFGSTIASVGESHARGGVTLAERDRGALPRETTTTPTQQQSHAIPSLNSAGLAYPGLQGAYGPLGGGYLRQPIGVGADR